jgi:hypothetical protein
VSVKSVNCVFRSTSEEISNCRFPLSGLLCHADIVLDTLVQLCTTIKKY